MSAGDAIRIRCVTGRNVQPLGLVQRGKRRSGNIKNVNSATRISFPAHSSCLLLATQNGKPHLIFETTIRNRVRSLVHIYGVSSKEG